MLDLIPIEHYNEIYLNFSLFIVLFTLLHCYLLPLDSKKNIQYLNITGYIFLFILCLYVGLRPISGKYFGDMRTYSEHFNRYAEGNPITIKKDVVFHYFMKFSSYIMTGSNFFLLCAILYIVPMYRVSKVFFKEYWFYAFLVLVVSFQFWPYATNGIRNGLSTSFFLLALSFYDKKVLMALIFGLGALFHQSVLLPVLAFCVSLVYSRPKLYLYGWLLAIPVSLVLGSAVESVFSSLGFAEDRLDEYLTAGSSQGGFRFDFLFYSSSAVFTGWYFIFKRNFNDKLYNRIYITYLITNAFWILVIRANFSNRFAYLSWFMIGLVIIYPYLKQRFYGKQQVMIGWTVFIYFGFTYFMNFIYYQFLK